MGITPVKGVPVAGWLNFKFDTVSSENNPNPKPKRG